MRLKRLAAPRYISYDSLQHSITGTATPTAIPAVPSQVLMGLSLVPLHDICYEVLVMGTGLGVRAPIGLECLHAAAAAVTCCLQDLSFGSCKELLHHGHEDFANGRAILKLRRVLLA